MEIFISIIVTVVQYLSVVAQTL